MLYTLSQLLYYEVENNFKIQRIKSLNTFFIKSKRKHKMITKENQSKLANIKNHPSMESKYRPPKPSIKVDYKVIHSQRSNKNQHQPKKSCRKIFTKPDSQISFISITNQLISRVRSVDGSKRQQQSGRFIESEYCPNQRSQMNESIIKGRKGKVDDAISKYHHSKSIQNILKSQNIKKRAPSCFIITDSRVSSDKTQRTQNPQLSRINNNITSSSQLVRQSRSKLPSYLGEGIKDIIEYEYAGRYKEEKVTAKCGVVINVPLVKDKFRAFDQIHDFDFRKRVNTLSNQVRLTKGLR